MPEDIERLAIDPWIEDADAETTEWLWRKEVVGISGLNIFWGKKTYIYIYQSWMIWMDYTNRLKSCERWFSSIFGIIWHVYRSFCPVPASGSSTTVRQAQVTNDEVWRRNFESFGITCFFSAWITGRYIDVKSYKYSMAKVNRRDQISGYRCLEARTPFMY